MSLALLFLALPCVASFVLHRFSIEKCPEFIFRKKINLKSTFTTIAEKMTGIVEFIQGQKIITAANIEDTINVRILKLFASRTIRNPSFVCCYFSGIKRCAD